MLERSVGRLTSCVTVKASVSLIGISYVLQFQILAPFYSIQKDQERMGFVDRLRMNRHGVAVTRDLRFLPYGTMLAVPYQFESTSLLFSEDPGVKKNMQIYTRQTLAARR